MRGLNKIMVIGNVGKDPEQPAPNITKFSVATSESWVDKNSGERVVETEWHNITAFNKLADIVAGYVVKGSKVYVEGKLKTNKWTDKDGIVRYATNIIADKIQILSSKELPREATDVPINNEIKSEMDESFDIDSIPF